MSNCALLQFLARENEEWRHELQEHHDPQPLVERLHHANTVWRESVSDRIQVGEPPRISPACA
jgi:hypothetical protein